MITDVRQRTCLNNRSRLGQEGQSLVEFFILFPAIIAMAVLLIRLNSVIQVGIVNQQWARAHLFFLAFNSPHFLERNKRAEFRGRAQIPMWAHQITIGISDNLFKGSDIEPGNETPVAITLPVVRNRKLARESDEPEPDEASQVRVRTTLSWCLPSTYYLGDGGQKFPLVQLPGGAQSAAAFDYCGGSIL